MNAPNVIVIGAGIGGLSAAAYLAKAGFHPLVLEQTPFPGGRCYSRVIDGVEYDIGALYLGDRVPQILQAVFDIKCAFRPCRIGIKIGNRLVSVPFDWRTLRELRRCQTPSVDILRFLMRLPRLFRPSYFDRYRSVGEMLDSLTSNENIRQIGHILFGVSGVSPYTLPSHYLRMDRGASGTRVGNPVHLFGGNRRVADLLTAFILAHGGRLLFQERAEQIVFKDGRACGVVTDRGEYTADFVISNADIRTTILKLSQLGPWDDSYMREVESLRQPLALICVFLTFESLEDLPDGFGVFFLPGGSPDEEFHALEAGQFPEQSTFCLQVPTNLEKGTSQYHRATLQFYHPRGAVAPEVLERQVYRVMTEGLERLFSGLSSRVLSYTVYDPARYEREFGLTPFVSGVSPDLSHQRFPPWTPVPNLYCVGDSVQPERPSVPQAMESGILCAQEIVRKVAGDQLEGV